MALKGTLTGTEASAISRVVRGPVKVTLRGDFGGGSVNPQCAYNGALDDILDVDGVPLSYTAPTDVVLDLVAGDSIAVSAVGVTSVEYTITGEIK